MLEIEGVERKGQTRSRGPNQRVDDLGAVTESESLEQRQPEGGVLGREVNNRQGVKFLFQARDFGTCPAAIDKLHPDEHRDTDNLVSDRLEPFEGLAQLSADIDQNGRIEEQIGTGDHLDGWQARRLALFRS